MTAERESRGGREVGEQRNMLLRCELRAKQVPQMEVAEKALERTAANEEKDDREVAHKTGAKGETKWEGKAGKRERERAREEKRREHSQMKASRSGTLAKNNKRRRIRRCMGEARINDERKHTEKSKLKNK
jgi:hypothetical protein